MKLTTEQYDNIKQLQESGVPNSVIASLYKQTYQTFMRNKRNYERNNNTG